MGASDQIRQRRRWPGSTMSQGLRHLGSHDITGLGMALEHMGLTFREVGRVTPRARVGRQLSNLRPWQRLQFPDFDRPRLRTGPCTRAPSFDRSARPTEDDRHLGACSRCLRFAYKRRGTMNPRCLAYASDCDRWPASADEPAVGMNGLPVELGLVDFSCARPCVAAEARRCGRRRAGKTEHAVRSPLIDGDFGKTVRILIPKAVPNGRSLKVLAHAST